MADDLNVDAYLEAVRRQLRGRHDRDELLDEIEDHLRSTIEHHRATGNDPENAVVETLRAFGEPATIAAALADANGSPAVPTTFTHGIGSVAMVGAGVWLLLPICFWSAHLVERSGTDWEGSPRLFFMVGMVSLAAGAVVALLTMLALRQRQGGFGPVATVGVGITGLAAAASMIAWAIPLWATLLALGCLPVAVAAYRHGAAPAQWAVVFGLAWPVGMGTLLVLRAVEFGEMDEWGDYPQAYLTGMTVGSVLMTAAVAGLGLWLRSEQPVDTDTRGPAIA